jgi:hypothetical protein
MTEIEEGETQESSISIFKRSMNHHCILLEVLSDSKNEEKIHRMQFWYPVSHISGNDVKDVRFLTIKISIIQFKLFIILNTS